MNTVIPNKKENPNHEKLNIQETFNDTNSNNTDMQEVSNNTKQETDKIIIPKEEVEKNWQLSDDERLKRAQELLWFDNLTEEQKEAIISSHNIWNWEKWKEWQKAWIYNYTTEQILKKSRILKWEKWEKDNIFDKKQREILIKNWITWSNSPFLWLTKIDDILAVVKKMWWIKQRISSKFHTYSEIEKVVLDYYHNSDITKEEKLRNLIPIDNDNLRKSVIFSKRILIKTQTTPDILNFIRDADDTVIKFLTNANVNVLPKYKIELDWHTFLLTDKFIGNSKFKVYWYVKVWDKYEPRLFYFSSSWWNWKSSLWYFGLWDYSKWQKIGLSYEKWTIVDPRLVSIIERLPSNNGVFEGMVSSLLYNWFDEKYEQKAWKEVNILTIATWWFFRLKKDMSTKEIKDNISKTPVNTFLLNDNNGLNYVWKPITWPQQQHNYLWKVFTYIQKLETKWWHTIEVVFAHNARNPELLWVEDIRLKLDKMNSYWIKINQINWWILTTKPLEYDTQVPDSVNKQATHYDEYVDIRPYIQENPLIKTFKKRLNMV